jgi:prepilin-type N-terminal cleavage/methylation domain-containing protein
MTAGRRLHRRLARRAGMGLVELMVALAIASALLTATGFALDAAIKAYRVNQEQSVLLQNTRLTMHRMLATIRRCKLHAPDDAALSELFTKGETVTDTAIKMMDDRDLLTAYRYDAENKLILLVAGDKSYPLIRGVEQFVVTLEPMRSPEAIRTGPDWDLLRRATIQMTVRTDAKTLTPAENPNERLTLTLSASVMPRRNTWY